MWRDNTWTNLRKNKNIQLQSFINYIWRSNEGISEELANDFKDSVTAQDDYFCDREYDDFIYNCKVLIQEGYLEEI